MKYCNANGYCGYKCQDGCFWGCTYEGYCDYQMPRDNRLVEPQIIYGRQTIAFNKEAEDD